MPAPLHEPSRGEGKTNHLERLFGTLRQRLSRLVRKGLSFSKKWAHHVGAIRHFLRHYNREIAPRLAAAAAA